MRHSTAPLLAAALILGMGGAPAKERPWRTLDGKPPLVIGHRGAPGYLPEHTLASYQRAIDLGADFIEPDLVATRDGELIARHDVNITVSTDVARHPEFAARWTTRTIDGITQEGWFASDFTLAEIKRLRACQTLPFRSKAQNGRYGIPTLDEIIQLAHQETGRLKRRVGVYPETKHPTYHVNIGLALEPRLLAALARRRWNTRTAPVIVQSFEVSNLKALRQQTAVRLVQLIDAERIDADGTLIPGRPYDFVARGEPRTYADLITDEGLKEIASYADGIAPWKRYLVATKGPDDTGEAGKTLLPHSNLVQRAHHAGLFVHPWTFRDEPQYLANDYQGRPTAEYRQYFELGADGVFSDFPDTALTARGAAAQGIPPAW